MFLEKFIPKTYTTATYVSISAVCSANHVVWYPDVCSAKRREEWNMVLNAMKYVTALAYRWALR